MTRGVFTTVAIFQLGFLRAAARSRILSVRRALRGQGSVCAQSQPPFLPLRTPTGLYVPTTATRRRACTALRREASLSVHVAIGILPN